jgi:EAL and modified HD-GYP domain-containing signal transduction protein
LNSLREAPVEVLDHISIARQPIVNGGRDVVAYELYNRTPAQAAHTVESDISLVLNAIANSAAPFAIAKSDLFVHALHEGLGGSHWDFLDPQKIIAVIPPVRGHHPTDIAAVALGLGALRSRGFRLCFSHVVVAPVYKAWQPLADFVKVDLATVSGAQMAPLLAAIGGRTAATPIAMKVETSEQFTQLQEMGVKNFQGYWLSHPELVTPRVLAPGELAAIKLFNLVSRSGSIGEVENALKQDAALGVNLLRIVNSASAGLRQKVTSLRQAVMLMGYEKVTKWSALVLATSCSSHSTMINASAILRGRMMELLAEMDHPRLDPGTAFLVGLLSQIEEMLGSPMQSTLAQLSINEEIVEALLGGEGVYSDMLSLVKACESEEEDEFSRAFSKLNFTLRQINLAHMQALAWADGALT